MDPVFLLFSHISRFESRFCFFEALVSSYLLLPSSFSLTTSSAVKDRDNWLRFLEEFPAGMDRRRTALHYLSV